MPRATSPPLPRSRIGPRTILLSQVIANGWRSFVGLMAARPASGAWCQTVDSAGAAGRAADAYEADRQESGNAAGHNDGCKGCTGAGLASPQPTNASAGRPAAGTKHA